MIASRTRRLLLLLLLTLGALGMTAGAASAITVSNVQPVPANTNAGANSDLALSFDLSGGQLRNLVIHLPPGLVGNPLATAATCSEAQLNANACPASSDVGDITNDVLVNNILPVTASGNVYNVTPRAGEPARFGFVLTTPGGLIPPVILQSPAVLRQSDFGLDTILNDVPNTAGGMPITITGVSLDLVGQVNGKGFLRNPTSCGTNTVSVDATAYDASTGSASGSFNTINCGALPFSPKFSASIKQTGSLIEPVEVSTTISQTIEEAGLRRAVVTLPADLGSNSVTFQTTCTSSDFNAGSCPANSIVGEARAASPLQSDALTGPVFLISAPGTLPSLGLDLRGALSLKLSGTIALDTSDPAGFRSQVTFDGLPDIPISDFTLTFAGGGNGLNQAARSPCSKPPFTFDTSFLAHSGATATATTEAKATCKAAGGKKPRAKLRLRAPKSGDPSLKLSLRSGAAPIRSAAVKAPRPLSFAKGSKFTRGAEVKGAKVKASKSTLKLTAKGKGTKKITGRIGDGALLLGGSDKVTKPFKVLIKDADGKRTKLSVKAK